MSGLPKGWASSTLAELSSIMGGKTPSKAEPRFWQDGTIPWVSPKDMKVFDLHDVEDRISDIAIDEGGMSLLPAMSILMVTRSGILAHTFPVAIAHQPVTINQDIKAVPPAPGFDARYLAFNLKSQGRTILSECAKAGTTVASVETAKLNKLSIPLAPLPEQKRIADKLDSVLARVEACRDRLDRIPVLLKRFRQSILAAATSGRLTEDWRGCSVSGKAQEELSGWLAKRALREKKPPAEPDLSHWHQELPEGWTVCSVHQFAECLDRLRVPIKRELRKNSYGLYPYYGANGEVGRIDEYIFDDELVLVTEDETFYGREKPIAYRASGRCWVNNHAHVLRAPSKVANDYLCFALMYYNVIPWLSGTTGRAKLTQQALNSLPIGFPPQSEIEEIVRRVETLFAFADRLEARCAAARKQVGQLTPALLAKAFRGELVPQDPADEPAAELLKRLAATRSESPKARRGRKADA